MRNKEIEIVQEFEKIKLDVLVLPETVIENYKKNVGTIGTGKGHLLLCSDVHQKERVTAYIIQKGIKNSLSNWKIITKRILTIKFQKQHKVNNSSVWTSQ